MVIKNSEFIVATTFKKDFPIDGLPELAIVGRSNVGKSSIINSMLNRRKIAKVSSTPGKTRTINFFLINKLLYLVDLPGYGYAKVSKSERDIWKKVVESYFEGREELKKVILLVDSRHRPSQNDMIMYEWIKYFNYDLSIVATKSDKLKKTEIIKQNKMFKEVFDNAEIFFYSSFKHENRDKLLEFIFKSIVDN